MWGNDSLFGPIESFALEFYMELISLNTLITLLLIQSLAQCVVSLKDVWKSKE